MGFKGSFNIKFPHYFGMEYAPNFWNGKRFYGDNSRAESPFRVTEGDYGEA
jgi:hypothetical protein